MKKRTTTATSRHNEPEVDLVSSLPDAILAEILSLLSTKLAVSTSVLSHRWRTLWTQVTSIDIDCRDFQQRSTEFYPIVDQLIPLITSQRIRSFCVRLPDPQHVPLSPVIGSWLRLICARNVERIEVTTEGLRLRGSGIIPFTLPHCIFQTPSLAVLDLFTSLDNNMPADGLINLPNLKKLHLNVFASQSGFVSKLTRSCPLLEEMYLYEAGSWDLEKGGCAVVLDLSCPSLKTMQLEFFLATASTKLVIDAPKLTSLVLLLSSFLTCSFVKKPIALREAKILCYSEAIVWSLLPVISNVSILRGLPFTLSRLKGVDDEDLIFPNLTDLIMPLDAGPTFGKRDDALSLFYHPPSARLLQHVKRIYLKVRDLQHGKHVLNLAKYILSNAPALEWLVFYGIAQSQSECALDVLNEEMAFCTELSRYTRSSPQSQIKFSGTYVKLPAGSREKFGLMSVFSSAFNHLSTSFTART